MTSKTDTKGMITEFRDLNFTLGNEDAWFDSSVAPSTVGDVLTTAGSGVRTLALLAHAPSTITCVDSSQAQLWLNELKVELVRALEYSDYMRFWGYPGHACSPLDRRELFSRAHLSEACKAFFVSFHESQSWEGILYSGRWERMIITKAWLSRWVMGTRWKRIFSAHNLIEQQQMFADFVSPFRLRVMVTGLAAILTFGKLLIPKLMPTCNQRGGVLGVLSRTFQESLTTVWVRQALFLQIYLCGSLVCPESYPPECDAEVYRRAKSALKNTSVLYVCGDIFDVACEQRDAYDAIFLSNIPSYLSGDLESSYLQRIRGALRPGGRVVSRFHLRTPEKVNRDGFVDLTERFSKEIALESTRLYEIEVLEKEQPG